MYKFGKMGRLVQIINTCTMGLRKEDDIITVKEPVGGIKVVSVNNMVKEDDFDRSEDLAKIDVHFFIVGVHIQQAMKAKQELIALLKQLPDEAALASGPSYIALGAVLGSQQLALQLIGLGRVLELWEVITPEFLGMKGQEADDAAGSGLVMMTGFDAQQYA